MSTVEAKQILNKIENEFPTIFDDVFLNYENHHDYELIEYIDYLIEDTENKPENMDDELCVLDYVYTQLVKYNNELKQKIDQIKFKHKLYKTTSGTISGVVDYSVIYTLYDENNIDYSNEEEFIDLLIDYSNNSLLFNSGPCEMTKEVPNALTLRDVYMCEDDHDHCCNSYHCNLCNPDYIPCNPYCCTPCRGLETIEGNVVTTTYVYHQWSSSLRSVMEHFNKLNGFD